MKHILLVYPPFCTPASPPYSITYLASFLKANCRDNIDVLDLNLSFHQDKFKDYQEYCRNSEGWSNDDWSDYEKRTLDFRKVSSKIYSENNKRVVRGENPDLFAKLLSEIVKRKPDIVAFSIVYSSQAFYTFALIKALKADSRTKGIITVIGGPSVNEKLIDVADNTLKNELELLELIKGMPTDPKVLNCDISADFSVHNLDDYFTPEPVIPIKTSTTCYYRRCTFCTHYADTHYFEYPLEQIKSTVVRSKQKHFFFIDDMIPVNRLLKIADMLKSLDVSWTCQLRPTADFDYETFLKLRESGMTMIMWGVESGCQRILDLIRKGTNTVDIASVLTNSHKAGIKNIVYTIVGFPSETKEEFLETVDFLKENSESIDLVNVSVFGLQKGSLITKNPKDFGIINIVEHERTVLEPRLTYDVTAGLSHDDARKIRKRYSRTIEKMDKFPSAMNFFREHMLCLLPRK